MCKGVPPRGAPFFGGEVCSPPNLFINTVDGDVILDEIIIKLKLNIIL